MSSVFTRILAGELTGRFVTQDERCAAFLTIAPIRPGHVLVVPRIEVDDWLDLDPALAAHLTVVAQRVGQAVRQVTGAGRVALIIAGFEVPHVHLHVLPADTMADLDFRRADADADPAALDLMRDRLLAALDA